MNGNNRLYRSTSEAMVGGVAAGLGNYFKVDPTFIRLGFVLATLFSGGMFLLVYGAMWLLIPTVGSTSTEPGQIVSENLNDLGNRVRGFVGGSPQGTQGTINGGSISNPDANFNTGQVQGQLPQGTSATGTRQGFNPKVLILVGGFFLLLNMGVFRGFHGFHMGFWWPLILIGVGWVLLSRRRP